MANKYVRQGAAGSGSGDDWTNAYTNLPSTLTRGNVYYIADGSYGAYTFDDAVSGTLVTEIRKATEADHGTSTGWSSTYGDGQAVWTSWLVYTDYWYFNGVRRNANWRSGALTEYGFKVSGGGPLRVDNGAGTGGDRLTFRYCDFQGSGRDSGDGDDIVYGLTGNSYVTFQYCALHDADRCIFLWRGGWSNFLCDSCYIARNCSSPASHSEMISITDCTDCTFSNNHIEDIEGTAVFAGINDGQLLRLKVFGNVFFHSAAYVNRGTGHNFGVAGFVFIANDASNDNTGVDCEFYNNSFFNVKGSYSGIIVQAGSGTLVRNNIWYDCVRTNNSFSGTISHCWYYNTLQDGDSTGTKQVASGGTQNIFADIAGEDFRLTSNTSAGQTLTGAPLIDPDGVPRDFGGTWSRGAFQYASGILLPATDLVRL